MRQQDTYSQGLRHNGIQILRGNVREGAMKIPDPVQGPLFDGENVPEAFKAGFRIMQRRWMAKTLGAVHTDFPAITPDLIEGRVESVDFGYDG